VPNPFAYNVKILSLMTFLEGTPLESFQFFYYFYKSIKTYLMKTQHLLKSIFTGLLLTSIIFYANADRIYILPGTGYNEADPLIVAAIIANGHTVVVASASSTTLPLGFTSTYIDPVNGYDWLCLFGNIDYTGITALVKGFIDVGGKVYYQHEVTCCTISSTGAAAYASNFTGLPIVPNVNGYICLASPLGGWIAANIDSCLTIIGNAYKGMDGVPLTNQIQATGDLNGATPSYTTCPNFGMYFSTTEFTGTAHKGAFVSLGDVNLWFDAAEPGTAPVNMHIVNYFFPNDTSTCYLFPPGPIGITGINSLQADGQLINIYFNPSNQQVEIKSNLKSRVTASVFNSIGQQVYYSQPAASEKLIINAENFSRGVYFVKVWSDSKTIVKKILIN
jgi:type IX secretion system substrate protein